jgi:hypothetical protein
MVVEKKTNILVSCPFCYDRSPLSYKYTYNLQHSIHGYEHINHPSHTLFSPSLNSLKTSPATRIASAGKPAIFATLSA